MKILQLGKFYPIRGGVEKVMFDLTRGISQRGIPCDMLCATERDLEIKLNDCGRLLGTSTWMEYAATKISPSMIFKLRRMVKYYDIIHIHHPDPMASLALLLSGYRGKVVLHWHSDILKQRWLLKLYEPLQKWVIRRADRIVGTSPVYLKGSPYLQEVQDKTVCLPISIEEMPRNSVRAKEIQRQFQGKKIIFSLGRMVAYKGFCYLVEAAQYLGDDYVVVIGGNGALRGELIQQIDALNLKDKVFLPGRISDEDLVAYYEASKVFCMPSILKTEAFGIVQIEAMSFGKPVVTTNIPYSGVSWVNVPGLSGINVEPRDAKALAEAIQEICKDSATYQQYSEGALKNFHDRFMYDKMIDDCLKIYKGL